jgi:hypothetical protein
LLSEAAEHLNGVELPLNCCDCTSLGTGNGPNDVMQNKGRTSLQSIISTTSKEAEAAQDLCSFPNAVKLMVHMSHDGLCVIARRWQWHRTI